MSRYSGREFSENDMGMIRDTISKNPNISRRGLSKLVCESLNWRGPAGRLKDMRCRVVLLEMQKDKLIKLPPVARKFPNPNAVIVFSPQTEPQQQVLSPVHELDVITLRLVDDRKLSKLWNEYIERYHYLGYKKLPGNQLRYIAYSGENIVALLGFAAAAWKTAARDRMIGWTEKQREKNLHLIINNARFLILPWIQSKNLASKLLSLAAKRLRHDWPQRYNYKPVLIETFVEIPRFTGGCYKAANWLHVGTTTGRGKYDRKHEAKLPKKDVWLFPLENNFKKKLCMCDSKI